MSVNVVEIAVGFEVATAQAALGGIWSVSLVCGGLSNSAVLRLAEQGQVVLDAPLPGQEWTPAQWLQHRAGVPDYGGQPAYHAAVMRGEDARPRATLLAQAPQAALFAPGTGWDCSNIGFLFLAELLEEVTRRDLDGALRALVLAPLGVTAPLVATTRADMARLPWPACPGPSNMVTIQAGSITAACWVRRRTPRCCCTG